MVHIEPTTFKLVAKFHTRVNTEIL